MCSKQLSQLCFTLCQQSLPLQLFLLLTRENSRRQACWQKRSSVSDQGHQALLDREILVLCICSWKICIIANITLGRSISDIGILQVFAFSEAKEEGKEKDEVEFESAALDESIHPQPKKKM